MDEKEKVLVSRRQLFRSVGVTSAVGGMLGSRTLLAACGVTPTQTEGPFYPVREQLDENNDLTTKDPGSGAAAKGEIVYIIGKVQDTNCRPVARAVVEMWQADSLGHYNHPSDTEDPKLLDANFQYWGRTVSSKDGRFLFKTIVPKEYFSGTPGWIRPPHLHYKVAHAQFKTLTTQMYFKGHPLNDTDEILKALTPEQRRSVIVPFFNADEKLGYQAGSQVGEFVITLSK